MKKQPNQADALLIDPNRIGLMTDLYELTMSAAYGSAGVADRIATFDLFFRELPPRRGYMVAAGLEQAMEYLTRLTFTGRDVDYLRSLDVFAHVPAGWFEGLRRLRFTGDVWAIPEGTVVFPGEPLLRVSGPVMESQIVETYLITSLAYATSVATKASRLVTAAGERTVIDFGARRAHGPQAGLIAARASYVGGCHGTSLVEAGERLGIPVVGTMAHSWIMALGDEHAAFEKFMNVFPDSTTLLIDTYDTAEGARVAVRTGRRPGAVRLDSGDLATLARQVRRIFDEAGWHDVKIFASGDLNEYKIESLLAAGAPINAFGVGTELTTVADAPSLGCVYKLADFTGDAESGRVKLSAGKRTYPGLKQVFRQSDAGGQFTRDVIGSADETLPGQPLLEPVMRKGQLIRSFEPLDTIRTRCRAQIARLPHSIRHLETPGPYPVDVSDRLQAEYERIAQFYRPPP